MLRIAIAALVFLTTIAGDISAQTNAQVWGNVTIDWMKSPRVMYEVDLEPKVLVAAPAGEPGWWNLDVTPSIEVAAKDWLDLTGELATGYTQQTDDENSFEVTPRAGVRFHLLSRDLPTILKEGPVRHERPPKRRLIVRDLVRVEYRNLFYAEDEPTSSVWRLRNRFEIQFPLNRDTITASGTRYLLADWEWFVPLDDPKERFANRQRIRAGFGYRTNFPWRFEAVYIWTRSRNTTEEGFATSDNAINVRMKRLF